MNLEMISLRDATEADLPVIAEMLNINIIETAHVYREAPVTVDERRTWFREHQTAGLPVTVACAENNTVVGWGALSRYRLSSGYRHSAEVSVYVAGGMHRKGIGARILGDLLERARTIELHALIASIDAGNTPSIALFERFGFVERARLPEVGYKLGAWRTQLFLHRFVDDQVNFGRSNG